MCTALCYACKYTLCLLVFFCNKAISFFLLCSQYKILAAKDDNLSPQKEPGVFPDQNNKRTNRKKVYSHNKSQRLNSAPALPGPSRFGVVEIELYQCLEFAHYQRVLLPSPAEDVLEIELCICVAISTLNKKINFNIKTKILV